MDNTNIDSLLQEGAVVEPVADEKKAKKSQMKSVLVNRLRETMKTDKTFADRVKTKSASLEVTRTLGFSDKGGLVVDSGKEGRSLVATSGIVGYEIHNIGTEAIPYKTAICKKGADGIWVATPTDAVLQPGDKTCLTRQYMTMLTAAPEFSFELANGKIQKGSGASKEGKSTKDLLEAYYFVFNKDTGLQVNDDEVKAAIAEKVEGKWVVKPEFEAVFGEWNNPKPTTKAARAPKAPKMDSNVAVANYVYTVILNKGDQAAQ